jgi:type III restriction enzyme
VRIALRTFQEDAVDRLVVLLDSARVSLIKEGLDQAVGLAAPTGSGKTVIATALIEVTLFGGDGEAPIDPGAVFLWLTDQPDLNEQTRDKMLANSSRLGPDRLVVVPASFDQDMLDPGRVYFLNTQKLAETASLAQAPGDDRIYPFWETVANTIEADDRILYVIVDEAHRGMTEGANKDTANSIIQRFIKGWNRMPPAPIVIGISATPERFQEVIEGTTRTSRRHQVGAGIVRASGLIKEHILTTHAGEKQKDEIALLGAAAATWKEVTEAWAAYNAAHPEEELVQPALIVQVENEAEGATGGTTGRSKTDLEAAIRAINDAAGPLPENAFVNAFQEKVDFAVGGRNVRYVAPPRISEDTDAKVVLFKTSLNQGWDCPRAEVMFSFRKATDYTSIAQLIGRMVRAPLARRIDEDERLNAVDLFLPHYDTRALGQIVKVLTETGDSAIADLISERSAFVPLPRRAGTEAAAAAIEAIPSYTVPTTRKKSDVRRLGELALALSSHGVDADAAARERANLAGVLLAARERLKDDGEFKAAVVERGEITIRRVPWAVGATETGEGETLTIPASDENVARLFAAAKRVLGGEVAMSYWKTRVAADASAKDKARLEAVTLATMPDVLTALEAAATTRIKDLFVKYGPTIKGLSSVRQAIYSRIRGQAGVPTEGTIGLTEVAFFRPGAEDWPLHLFAREEDGQAALNFTSSWEVETLREELKNPELVAWLRNPPRKDWSFCVPFMEGTTPRPMYPDFLLVREVGGKLLVDIIDPHDPTAADAADKARGLAEYALRHGHLVGRIELVAKLGGKLRRLDLKDEPTRKKVAGATTPKALELLYPSE